MIGLDTNIVVRHLVGDDPDQTRRTRRFLATRCTVEHPGFVNRVVLCEVAWVLSRSYGYSRAMIADAIDRLLHAAELQIEDHEAAANALDAYRASRADFADCFIGQTNSRAGCTGTATFDENALRLAGFITP